MSAARELFESIENIDTIRRWIADRRPEGILLDYKQTQKGSPGGTGLDGSSASKLVGRPLSALANTEGGVVVYGVKTRTLPPDPLDYPDSIEQTDPALEQKIRNWASVHVVPGVPGLELRSVGDTATCERVIAAFVPQSPMRPHQVRDDKLYYRRTADEAVAMEHAHVELLFRSRIGRELAHMPLVAFFNEAWVMRTSVRLHVLNYGNAPALNVRISYAGQRIYRFSALGVGERHDLMVDVAKSPGGEDWPELVMQGENRRSSEPLLIEFSDLAGARYEARWKLLPDGRKGGLAPVPEMDLRRIG